MTKVNCIFVYTLFTYIYHFFFMSTTFHFFYLFVYVDVEVILGVNSRVFCRFFYFCLAQNLLNDYSTIYQLNPFFLKKIFFSVIGIFSIFSPWRNRTATEIFCSLSSSFLSYYYYFFFFLVASEFPIKSFLQQISDINVYKMMS